MRGHENKGHKNSPGGDGHVPHRDCGHSSMVFIYTYVSKLIRQYTFIMCIILLCHANYISVNCKKRYVACMNSKEKEVIKKLDR